jgi:hypothetical protein
LTIESSFRTLQQFFILNFLRLFLISSVSFRSHPLITDLMIMILMHSVFRTRSVRVVRAHAFGASSSHPLLLLALPPLPAPFTLPFSSARSFRAALLVVPHVLFPCPCLVLASSFLRSIKAFTTSSSFAPSHSLLQIRHLLRSLLDLFRSYPFQSFDRLSTFSSRSHPKASFLLRNKQSTCTSLTFKSLFAPISYRRKMILCHKNLLRLLCRF